MLEHIKQVLDNAGVTPDDAAALAPLVTIPPAEGFTSVTEHGRSDYELIVRFGVRFP